MSIWDDGYFTEENYTHGYYKDLGPVAQRFQTILCGYEPLPVNEENIHMELGIGFGMSTNIHAATNLGSYIGNDFNPAQVQFAQSLADASQAHVSLYEQSFEEMAMRDDLPQCNSISLHGIWNWVSEHNRQHILTIIKKCLKPGGIVYNSYNVSSGHSAFISWRILMYEHFKTLSGTPIDKTKRSLEYLENIFKSDANILKQNIVLANEWDRIQHQIKVGNYAYLLHEYFNSNWDNTTLINVSNQLAEAKLSYLGSTSFNPYLNVLFLPKKSQALITAQSSLLEQETLQDNLIHRAFRQDYFIKGGLKMSNKKTMEYLNQQKFVATKNSELIAKDIKVNFNQDIFNPIIECLIKNDYAPKTFKEIFDCINSKKYNHNNVLQVLLVLIQSASIQPCLDSTTDAIKTSAHNLNKKLLENFEFSYANVVLASPITGSGIYTDILQAIAVLTHFKHPKAKHSEWIDHYIDYLAHNDLSINDDNKKKLSDRKDIKAYIEKNVSPNIPLWKALGILP